MHETEVQKTTAVLAAALLIAFLFLGYKLFLLAALLLLIGSAADSRINVFIATYWMKFSKIIGEINSRVLISIVFFVILTPLSVFFRFFNRSAVDHFKRNTKCSYFTETNKQYDQRYFRNQW